MGPRYGEECIGGIKLDGSSGKIRETGKNRFSIYFHSKLYVFIKPGVVSSSLLLPLLNHALLSSWSIYSLESLGCYTSEIFV